MLNVLIFISRKKSYFDFKKNVIKTLRITSSQEDILYPKKNNSEIENFIEVFII